MFNIMDITNEAKPNNWHIEDIRLIFTDATKKNPSVTTTLKNKSIFTWKGFLSGLQIYK